LERLSSQTCGFLRSHSKKTHRKRTFRGIRHCIFLEYQQNDICPVYIATLSFDLGTITQGRVAMAGKVMTKSQLISLLAEKSGVTKTVANQVIESLATTAVTETKKNGQFVIPGIGKLVKSQRKARMGRNPQTGAAIKIPAKTVVKFRVAKAAKDAVVPPKK
jgi:DNA-binding protein HU-beta